MDSLVQTHKNEMEDALASLRADLQQKTLEHTTANSDLESLRERHAESSNAAERTQTNLQDAQQTIVKLQEELKNASDQAANTSAPTNDSEMASLQKRLDQAQQELADTTEALKMSQLSFQENLDQTHKHHEAELQEKETARVEAEQKLRDAVAHHHQQFESLKGQMDSLKKEQQHPSQRPGSAASAWSAGEPPLSPGGRSSSASADHEMVSLHNAHNAKVAEKDAQLEKERKAREDLEAQVQRLQFELSMHQQDVKEDEEL